DRPLTARETLQIHARAGRLVRSGDHTDAQIRSAVQQIQRVGDLVRHPQRHRRACLGTVHLRHEDAAVLADLQFRRAHRGDILIAPSSRIVSPLRYGFSMICWASIANSSGLPSRFGLGTWAPRRSLISWGNLARIGVSNTPGATVSTRAFLFARSRAAPKVMPTTPALAEAYGIWPTWPSHAATEAVSTHAPRSPSTASFFAIRVAARRRTLNVPIRLMSTSFR